MNYFAKAYVMAVLPRSSWHTAATGDQRSSIGINYDALDQGLSALVYKSIDTIERVVRDVVNTFRTWHKRQAAIRELKGFDDHILKDIGLRRSQIPAVVEGLLNSTN